jgi:hypothetical protein
MTNPSPDKSPRLNPRVIAMLIAFIAIISATVIITDIFSPRDRHPISTTTTAASLPAAI